jgi:tetraacyldisaccharide 4'-kinase
MKLLAQNPGEYGNPYAISMAMRRTLYRSGILKSAKVDVPVISVGNLTVGGTGKTPITKLVVRFLRDECGKRVAIVMRGYKRATKGLLVVSDGVTTFADATASGDEAQLYAEELADVIVVCDEERVRGAHKAIELGAQVIVLDDGYQHLAIHRDLNILLLSAREPSGAMIPLGRFREAGRAAQDADVILITGSPEDDFANSESVVSRFPLKPFILVSRALLHPTSLNLLDDGQVILEELRGKRVLALSSIAVPERFHRSLESLGADVIPFVLPDHSTYDERIATDVITAAGKASCQWIVQTSKDAVKSTPFFRQSLLPVATLNIDYEIHNIAKFFDLIRAVL